VKKVSKQSHNVDLKKGQEILLTIKKIGINGEGIGYYKKKVVFVPGTIPDEVVEVIITKVETGFAEGKVKKIKKKSPHRRQAFCTVYGMCGGCQMQHIAYEQQLKAKEEIVKDAFAKYTKIEKLPLRPIIGMDDPVGYRNKAQFQVGEKDGKLIAGLYSVDSHRLIEIKDCPVQHSDTNEMIEKAAAILGQLGIAPYDEKKKRGVVRTIVARVGFETGEKQLTFVTATDKIPREKELVAALRTSIPDLKGISQNINREKTSLIFGEKTRTLWGSERINESLGTVKFSLSPRSFFQLNPVQTVKLYDTVKEAAALTGQERVVDAYCGVGTIALWLAPYAKEVWGVELTPEAVEDARNNATLSGIKNARFIEGKAEEWLPRWVKEGLKPDVVVVDPPRTGCGKPLLDAVLKTKPARFVYVSCNPSSLARDVAYLGKKYRLEWIQPVDMFPHTGHAECVILMSRVEK
jgi:23S rRNA (uracil1939-C5)-methyltransferase